MAKDKKEKYPQAGLGSGMLRKAADMLKGREKKMKNRIDTIFEPDKKKK